MKAARFAFVMLACVAPISWAGYADKTAAGEAPAQSGDHASQKPPRSGLTDRDNPWFENGFGKLMSTLLPRLR